MWRGMSLYVSITGLTLRSPWHGPRFWWHATRAMAEAQRHPGCRSASARTIRGVHHTLTVWESREAMRSYLTAPRHLAAMRIFDRTATGKTCGYETETPPDWSEARDIWEREGREVGRA